MIDGEIGKGLLEKPASKGIICLTCWDNGLKQMSAKKVLKIVDGFKGLEMRIQSLKVLEVQMQVLGANPRVMVFSEILQALQSGAAGAGKPHCRWHLVFNIVQPA